MVGTQLAPVILISLVIPNRAEGPVRACPERSRREPAVDFASGKVDAARERSGRARVPLVPIKIRKKVTGL